MCEPGEKGHKGFEEFTDVIKHVARENGIELNDLRNLYGLIRIPSLTDYLKV